jgi:hypothetical protein
MATNKKLFSLENIKWLIKETLGIYSPKDSFFSKKRIESGIAFAIAQWGMITFLVKKIDLLTISDMLIWAGVEFAVAGYMINQIQKEKALYKSETPPTDGTN